MSSLIYTCTPSRHCRYLLPCLPSGLGWSGILTPGQVCAQQGHNRPVQLKGKMLQISNKVCSIQETFFFFFVVVLQLSSSCSTVVKISWLERTRTNNSLQQIKHIILKTWDYITVFQKKRKKKVAKCQQNAVHLCRRAEHSRRGVIRSPFFQTHTNESFTFENEREILQNHCHTPSLCVSKCSKFTTSWEIDL